MAEEITISEMVQRIIRMGKTHKEEIQRRLPIELGNAAVNIFVANFDKQGFDTGVGVEPWKEVKRRTNASLFKGNVYQSIKTHKYSQNKAAPKHLSSQLSAILIQSGRGRQDVQNSRRTPIITNTYISIPFEVADRYMGYHNYGGSTDGRPPQRKFMGDSELLHKIGDKKIAECYNRIFSTK